MTNRGRPKKLTTIVVDDEHEPSTKNLKHLQDIELLNLLDNELDEDDEFFSEDSLGYEYNY